MGLFTRRRSIPTSRANRALTAAGERLTAASAEQQARLNKTWQRRSFLYYDELGEIKYAATFFARLAKLELFVGEWQTVDGETELVPTEDKVAQQALARIHDPGTRGRSGLLANYGRLRFLAGEAILFYTKDEDGEEQWEMLSTSELRPNPLGAADGRAAYQRQKAPELSPTQYRDPGDDEWEDVDAKEAIGFRFWRKHPQWSEWADAPMRGVLELCEQLLMLDRAVRSRSISRTAGNGILFIDSRITQPPTQALPDEDIANDEFLDDLTKTMVEPMSDEGSAEHVVPLLARVDVPPDGTTTLKDMVYHLRLVDPAEMYPESGLRMEVITRIALGLEMPPEILTGMAQGNHWSAWLVSDEAWNHLEPYAQELCDDLTGSYLVPTLRGAGVKEPEKYAVGYDAARLRTEPEKAKDAKDLHDRCVIGDEALRDATGFTETDAPTEFEIQRWVAVHAKDAVFAMTGQPGLVKDTAQEPGTTPGAPTNETSGGPPGSPSETDQGPPDQPVGETPPLDGLQGASQFVVAQVLAACQVGVVRAREVASNRVRSKAKGNTDAEALLAGANGHHIPFVLGATITRQVAGQEAQLVAGAEQVLTQPLRSWGLTATQADRIVDAVKQHAVATMYMEHAAPLPRQFANFVAETLNG